VALKKKRQKKINTRRQMPLAAKRDKHSLLLKMVTPLISSKSHAANFDLVKTNL